MDNVFTSSIMSKQQDFVFLSKLMANANMGWWEANLATECYTCSEYISEILNLDDNNLTPLEALNKVRQRFALSMYSRCRKSFIY